MRASPSEALRNTVVLAGLALAALLLAIHVRTYVFLTDDAFISFRYARNLSHGYGLVFNPGGERVEGYTNLLWVLLLAGLDALGLAPEKSATALSFAATAALFGLVVRFVWARVPRGRVWLALLPALFLASTRSFAVWASSGLETRFFELLLVAGILRLVTEMEDLGAGRRARRVLSPWLFGLAALTRPDGILVGGCVLLASLIYQRWKMGRIPWGSLARWWPVAALVGASLAFRLAYYGEWLPNTYYAKVGAPLSLARGARYLAAFAVEYGALLWLPGLVAAAWWHRRASTLFLPLLFAAAILPHALYIAMIGGDHFEYRPLDFYLPLVFLLLADGARAWASSRAGAWAVAAYAGLVVFGLAWLPLRTHLEFPKDYLPGFPGAAGKIGYRFLAQERDPVSVLPIFRDVAMVHRHLVWDLTAHFAAIRQEEHRMFLEKASDQARRLEGLLARGVLPRDVYVALDCVGIIPYRTGLRTLDRHGLTDANVAHTAFVKDLVAHGKYATLDYARERGVDLWSADPVDLVCVNGNERLEEAIRQAQLGRGEFYAADLGSGEFLFCQLPQGADQTTRRLPGLPLKPVGDASLVTSYLHHFVPNFLDDLREEGVEPGRAQRLGEISIIADDLTSATRICETALQVWPRNWRFHWMLSMSRHLSGDQEADASFQRAVSILREDGDSPGATRLIEMFQKLRRQKPPGAGSRLPG